VLALLAALGAPTALGAASCSVSANAVSFGVYNPLSGTPLTSMATLTTTCTQIGNGSTRVSFTVSLSTGASGSYASRTLISGASKLSYNLYPTAAYQSVWGDGSGISVTVPGTLHVTGGRPLQQQVNTIYGQIPAGQDVGAGSYLDTIVVTVNY
jgi:spore coat protein U-like protein